ncbi:MAG: D-2-hydroxyacid dehydrogenase [Bryobacterales bacterium]|nr:D-2-hydroxyacid dehydrogenase [Bryobacterales bacterium]
MKLVLHPGVEARRLARILEAAGSMEVVNCSLESEAISEMAEADAFFGKLTPPMLAAAGRLRWVQSPTASLEHYVFPQLVNHPAQLTNMRGLFHDNIADHVLGCMLCFCRNLHIYIRQQQRRLWKPHGGPKEGQSFQSGPAVTTSVDLAHTTLASATLGVVGLGSIGSEVARRGICLGMRVLAVDSDPRPAPAGVRGPWPVGRLNDLLEESDYVVIAAPHTPETEGMFCADRFARMKPTAVVINIGRGVIVKLDDLTEALRCGQIGGAALDVYETEPLPKGHPLWAFENVILTPHVAGHSPEIASRHLEVLLGNLRRFVRGEPLKNVVDKRRWF